jgi:hypothetical protein
MDAFAASWEAGARLRRVGWLLHARAVEAKHAQLVLAFKAGFNPNQPRVPAGNSDGGQWTGGGSGSSDASGGTSAAISRQSAVAPRGGFQVVGGFTKEQMGLTVETFVSSHCQGLVHSILPGQFYQMTIAEVKAAAKSGDAAARRCLKLLGRDEYRK